MQTLRQMLLDAGVSSFLADMAIPFMWFTPGTVDPDAPSVIEIIRGVQRSLRALGYRQVLVSGVLDRDTAAALSRVAGRGWMSKAWVQIYGDVESAKKNAERTGARDLGLAGFGEYFDYRGVTGGPFTGRDIGTPGGPLGMGTVDDAGVKLNFGQGIRDKSAMVPIPRSAGATYQTFKRLQRAINRLLSARSDITGKVPGGRVGEDGVIGTNTFEGFKKVQDEHFMASFPGDTNSAGLAAHAATLASILEQKADSLGVAAQANRGSTTTSTEQASAPLTEGQAIVLAARGPGVGGALKRYLPLLALAGGIAYYAAQKRKKGMK